MEIPVDVRRVVIKYRKHGKSLREIGEIIGKSFTTVLIIIRNYEKKQVPFKCKATSGHPKNFRSINRQQY